jgi:hypothetical protein
MTQFTHAFSWSATLHLSSRLCAGARKATAAAEATAAADASRDRCGAAHVMAAQAQGQQMAA